MIRSPGTLHAALECTYAKSPTATTPSPLSLYSEAPMLTDLGDLSQVQAARLTGLSVPGMKAGRNEPARQQRDLLTECCEVALDKRRQIADPANRSMRVHAEASRAPDRQLTRPPQLVPVVSRSLKR